MKSLIFSSAATLNGLLPNLGMLLLRLGVGLTMAIAHGMGKTPPSEQLIQGVTGMGFPLPILFAWAAALSELIGGFCIAIGLATRLFSASLAVTMAVAFFVAHGADPFQVKELSFVYLFYSIAIFLIGPGKWSVDSRIK